MKKKILAFALCMLLVANPCLAASTGVVTVSGGSIATGGLSGGYSEKTESAALTLTMAMLYGLGVSVKLSQDAINAGQSAYSFVKNKFYEWVGGTSAEQLDDSQYEDLKSRFEIINSGSNIDPDGNIYFNATAVDLIRRFLKWLDVSDYINSNNGSNVNTGSINGVSTLYTNHIIQSATQEVYFGTARDTFANPTNLLFYRIIDGDDTNNVIAVGLSAFYFRFRQISSGSYVASAQYVNNSTNGYYWYLNPTSQKEYVLNNNSGINTVDVTNLAGSSKSARIETWLNGGNGNIGEGSADSEGFNYDGEFDPDILNNPDNNNLVVKPDLVQGLQENNPNQQINIPVEQYLEALKQILNQATNPQAVPEPIPAQDLPTLSPVPVEVPADLPLEWPVELPSSPDATPDLPTDNTPVTDPSAPVNPVDALPELTFNLDEYFPFCIPFDIYHLLSKFSADPVTPVFDIGFTEPFSNTNVNFHIDLSPWDSVASAIRTAELGAFIVGLAVASRAIFTRG